MFPYEAAPPGTADTIVRGLYEQHGVRDDKQALFSGAVTMGVADTVAIGVSQSARQVYGDRTVEGLTISIF